MRMKFTGRGGAAFLNANPEALLTQTILGQAATEAEAKKQVAELLAFVEKLGTVTLQTDYGAKEFRFDLSWKIAK